MIAVFRKNDLINVLLLLPYCIILRLYSFIKPTLYRINASDSYISKFIFEDLLPNPNVQAIVGVILIYLQAIIINQLVNQHRIYQRPSSLAGMTYVLLVSFSKELQMLTPALIAMTFLILATNSVFNTYKQTRAIRAISNAALSASLATIIYPPYALAIIPLLIGLGMLRSFRLKERLQFIISWGVGFWIIGSILFFLGVLQMNFWSDLSILSSVGDIYNGGQSALLIVLPVILLVLIVLANYYNYKKKKGIEIRKKLDFFYWVLLMSLPILILYDNLSAQFLLFFCFPVAIFLSLSWVNIRYSYAELLHFIVVGLIFYNLFLI